MTKNPVQLIKLALQSRINRANRRRLTNFAPTLVGSNCTIGFLYHWLGLQFRSPFINLWMTNNDFVTMLENWNAFLDAEITECVSDKPYPVGKVHIGGGVIS